MIRTVARSACVACGGRSEPLFTNLPDGLYDAPGMWNVVQCADRTCRTKWLDPAPHPDDLIELYKNYFTHSDTEARRGAEPLLRSVHRVIENLLLAPFGIAAERLHSQFMFLHDDPRATLLDVGCGDGTFLKAMARRGWTVTGVDFDATAVRGIKESSGLEAYVGTTQSMSATGRKFGVVTANHVIEHVSDPVKFLAECGQLAEADGRVIIRTPNAASLGSSIYGRSWYFLDPPRHLCVFTRDSLMACGEKAGLRPVSCVTTDANAGIVLAASHFLRRDGKYRWDLLSKPDALRFLFIALKSAVRARFALRKDVRCGEELHAVFCTRIRP